MKRNSLILIFVPFFLPFLAHAQAFQWGRYENGVFNNIQNATVSDVSSDFGMRNAGTGASVFHKGVDIAPTGAQNLVLIAPFNGTIEVINAPNANIKTLEFASIDNQVDPIIRIKFLHIFPNGHLPQISNGFRLERIQGTNIIVDMVNCRAFADVAGIGTTCNGQPSSPTNPAIFTQTDFEQGFPLAPMGNSGYISEGQPYAYHVHVTQLENNSHDHGSLTDCIDAMHQLTLEGNTAPLSTRLRNRDATPAIDLNHDANCEHNGNWGAFIPSYTNNTKNIVEIEVFMQGALAVNGETDRYANGFMNEYIIDSRIRASGTNNFELIQGSRHYSYFRMNPIGAEVVYPGTSYGGTGDGNAGCSPYAYTEDIGFHPHDYYLFPNFYLRIHENHVIGNTLLLADYPWDARYPDGDYQIRSSVINIDNVTNNGDIIDFDIDNFKPFVKEVGVNFPQVGATVYWNSWNSTTIPSQLELGTRAEGGLPNLNPGTLDIYAVLSETMQDMTAEIPSLNTGQVAGAVFDASINKWRFTFNLASGLLQYGQCHKIIFRGRDLNNNQLLDFQIESQNPQVPTFCNWGINKRVLIPKRTDVNAWDAATASGLDEVHRFRILECGGFRGEGKNTPLTENTIVCETLAEDVSEDIHFASGSQVPDGSISLTVSGNPDVQTIWYDTDRQEIGQGLEIQNLEPGVYCYEMKIECCIISDCFEVGVCGLNVQLTPNHPSAEGVSDGSIDISQTGGNEPITYLWSTGATTSTISNLNIGIYTVTVSDTYHCSSTRSISLIVCPVITVTQFAILSQPSTCDATDGGIQILESHIDGGVLPYTNHWEDGDGNIMNLFNNQLSNVSPGTYCFVVVDALGCVGSICYELLPDHYPNLVTESITPTCSGQDLGSILIEAINPIGTQYDFYWDNGQYDWDTNGSYIENLAAGEYCVTITSEATGCELIRCYDVPALTPSSPLAVSVSYINPCPNLSNGSINLTVTGGIEPYLYNWADLTSVGYPKDRVNLSEGFYVVTVTDHCGTQIVKEVSLIPLNNFKPTATAGCAGQGSVSVSPDPYSGNPPFQIQWQNGANTYNISSLNTGEYCFTITDNAGCAISNCVSLANSDFTISMTEPCIGFSDGIISLDINNPQEGSVIVTLNGAVVYNNPITPPTTIVNIPSLSGGTNFNIGVSIAGCIYPPDVITLNEHPVTTEFDHYDQPTNECIYNDVCNGIIIPGSTTTETPAYDITNGSGGFFSECKIPVSCDGQFVLNKHIDKKTVRAAEYEQILLQAIAYFPFWTVYSAQEYFYSLGLKDCDKVRYCPANLKITTIIHTISPLAQAYSNGEGCFSLDCSILPGNNNFCVHEILPPLFGWLPNQGVVTESCNPVSINLYQLILWEDQLVQLLPPSFLSSPLYSQFIDVYRNDERAKCARIIFCENDFSVPNASHQTFLIDQISCDDYADINTGVSIPNPLYLGDLDCTAAYQTENECLGYTCLSPFDLGIWGIYENENNQEVNVYGHNEYVCPEFPGDFLTGGGNDELIKIVQNGACQGTLANFGSAILNGRRIPKGLTRCGDYTRFMDYSINSRLDAWEEIPDIEYLIDSWDSSRITYVRNIQPALYYQVESKGDQFDWSIFVNGSSFLNVRYFDKQGDIFLMAGEFQGLLTIGGNQIANEIYRSGYYIRISNFGQVIDYKIIEGLDSAQKINFVQGTNGIRIVGYPLSNLVTINENSFPVLGANSIIDIVFEGELATQVKNVSQNDPNYAIERVAKRVNGMVLGAVTYLLKKNVGSVGDQIKLLTISETGDTLWSKIVNTNRNGSKDFDIKYNTEGDLIFAMTFSGTVTIDDTLITSSGGSDIALLRFDNLGTLKRYRQYGSSEDESVSRLFLDEDMIYFGGELVAETTSKAIGRHKFISLAGNTISPYISFISDSDILPHQERPIISDRNRSGQDIAVFPNPVNDELVIRIKDMQKFNDYHVKMFDLTGKLVREARLNKMGSGNEIYLSKLKDIPSGVYLIELLEGGEPIYHTKIVKE
jgi:Secretion system C-terminal sorting domain/SprB repeat